MTENLKTSPSGQSSPLPESVPQGPAPLPVPIAAQRVQVAGHELTVYDEWPALLDAMLRDIAAAQRRVWMETYIFFNDDGGKRIAEALKQRARAGVDVRLLYDAFGSTMTPASFFSDMEVAGVHVHAFHSFFEGLKRFRLLRILNRRNHRKLLVIDDTAAYFGGMNIIDNVEAAQAHPHNLVPSSAGWRDVHVRLTGPQHAQIAASFDRSWLRALRKRIRRTAAVVGIPDRAPDDLHRGATDGLAEPAPRARKKKLDPFSLLKKFRLSRRPTLAAQLRLIANRQGPEESILFVDCGFHPRRSRVGLVYATLIRGARRQITIAMAYFLPVGPILRALLRARRRRVAVRVIMPGNSDVPLVQHAISHLYDRLLRRGFRLYERRQRMMHSKVMIVDDQFTVVGSANMDPRSMYSNLEFLAVIRSRELAGVMQHICRFEIANSERITMAYSRRHGWWQRLINGLAWMARWWL